MQAAREVLADVEVNPAVLSPHRAAYPRQTPVRHPFQVGVVAVLEGAQHPAPSEQLVALDEPAAEAPLEVAQRARQPKVDLRLLERGVTAGHMPADQVGQRRLAAATGGDRKQITLLHRRQPSVVIRSRR